MTSCKLRICLMGTLLSIGVMEEEEFHQRISQASGGQVQVTFMIIRDPLLRAEDKPRQPRKRRLLPSSVSYLFRCIRNLPMLARQDIFITNGPHIPSGIVWTLSKLLHKKSMLTIHGHFEQEWSQARHHGMNMVILGIIRKYMLSSFDMIVVNDEHLGDSLRTIGISPSRIFTRYVFADTEKFNRDNVDKPDFQAFRQKYSLPEAYVLFVGKLTSWDGADDMLEVIKRVHAELPAEKFVFVGEGELRVQIDSFIEQNHLNGIVNLTGFISKEIMPLAYYGAKVLVLPNHPPQGGVGRIYLEGLSMEIPVVAYDIGEFRKIIIDGETGYLIPEGDIDLMAIKITALLNSPALRERMGTNGRSLVQTTYDIEGYINSWLESLYVLVPDKRPDSNKPG